jgi:rhodanese-related sulfurtransferase
MRNDMSWGRRIAVMVAVGAGLGVLYNGAGLLSHPPRGIPWLAAKSGLEDLDTLVTAPPGTDAAAQDGAEAASPPSAPDAERSAAVDPARVEAGRSTDQAAGAGRAAPAAGTARTPQAPSAQPAGAGSSAPPREAAPSTSTSKAAGTTPASTSAEKPAVAETAAPPAKPAALPVPVIPESDQPVRVKLSTTKILFDAGAALFLDARDAGEFEAGHIPGAIRMTREDALSQPERVKALPVNGRPIVAYCDGGACEASLELAQALIDAGYRKVLVYREGFPVWAASGYPVERAGAAK